MSVLSPLRLPLLVMCAGLLLGISGCSYSHDESQKKMVGGYGILAREVFKKKEASSEWKTLYEEGRPQIIVFLPSRHAGGNLLLQNTLGDVKTWITADNISISTRHGVIIATRGITPDLISADVSESLALLRSGKNGRASRMMSYLDGEGRIVTHSYKCNVTNKGDDAITASEKSIPVWSMEEVCYGLDDRFTNLYWVARSSGEIIQARQRINREIGDMTFRMAL